MPHGEVESGYAWTRLAVTLILSTIGGVGMWSVVVALPAVQAEFAVARADSCADGDKLGQGLAPLVACDFQAHAHDSVRIERVSFFFHTGHGQLARVVHGLG